MSEGTVSSQVDSVPEQRTVRPDGVEIAYWVHGEGQPLALIMGWGTPAATWGPLPSILASRGFKAIAIDNRDCGRSSSCDGISYGMEEMAGDVAGVLEQEGIEESYILGVSMGGMIAQELTLGYPDLVSRLMLISTHPGRPVFVPPDPDFFAKISVPRETDPQAITESIAFALVGPKAREELVPTLKSWAGARATMGSDGGGIARQFGAIAPWGSWDRLGQIDIPTLVIHGEADELIPHQNGVMLSEKIPGAELISLPGVGHLVPLESPLQTFEAIDRHFPVRPTVESA